MVMPVNKAFRPPPLSFSGNKRFWAGELYDEAALLPAGATVWDCFGGSGVCARCVKDARPDCRVVWNDYDGYADRLLHIQETEDLRRALVRVCGYEGCEETDGSRRRAPLRGEVRDRVHALCLSHAQRYGYFDGVSVRRWLSIGAIKAPYDPNNPPSDLYARIPRGELAIAAAQTWLDGLERVRCDFSELSIKPGDYLILDPPFAATSCDEYSGRETLKILRHCRDLMGSCPYILFGDASISFWYDILTEKFNPRFFIKENLIAGFSGKRRSEVMYSTW